MKKIDKKLYEKLVKRIKNFGEYSKSYNAFILDLKDSCLFYYESTGKILQKKQNEPFFTVIHRSSYDVWVLRSSIQKLLKKTLKNDEV